MSHANPPVDPAALAQPGSMGQVSTGPNRAMIEGAHHDHHGPPYLAHQFDDLDQQRDASTLGMMNRWNACDSTLTCPVSASA